MSRGKGKGPMGVPLEGDNVMDRYQIMDLIDTIINEREMEEGEPNDLKNEPSQNPEEELDRVEDDMGGYGEGDELEDYMEGEDDDDDDDDDDEIIEMVERMVDSTILDQDNAYQSYFRNVMKKHNIDGIRGLSPEKRSAFFKDVSSGWKKHKNGVKESMNIDEVEYNDYKKYFKYLADQAGIDDMSLLEDEDVVQFYVLVNEAYEVGTLLESYKDVFKNMMDKFDVSSIKDLKGAEKKAFFNQLDSAWKGKEEKEVSDVRDKVTDLLK